MNIDYTKLQDFLIKSNSIEWIYKGEKFLDILVVELGNPFKNDLVLLKKETTIKHLECMSTLYLPNKIHELLGTYCLHFSFNSGPYLSGFIKESDIEYFLNNIIKE